MASLLPIDPEIFKGAILEAEKHHQITSLDGRQIIRKVCRAVVVQRGWGAKEMHSLKGRMTCFYFLMGDPEITNWIIFDRTEGREKVHQAVLGAIASFPLGEDLQMDKHAFWREVPRFADDAPETDQPPSKVVSKKHLRLVVNRR